MIFIKMNSKKKKVIIYIDGSNFYFSIKKAFNCKVDIEKFCKKIVGEDDLITINYYISPSNPYLNRGVDEYRQGRPHDALHLDHRSSRDTRRGQLAPHIIQKHRPRRGGQSRAQSPFQLPPARSGSL